MRPELGHVELVPGEANDLSFLADDSIDLVILNSIVQYFPTVEYLLDVLQNAIRVTKPEGHVFIGDVRSLPLLQAFHASVQFDRCGDTTSMGEVNRWLMRAIRNEKELVLDA